MFCNELEWIIDGSIKIACGREIHVIVETGKCKSYGVIDWTPLRNLACFTGHCLMSGLISGRIQQSTGGDEGCV